MEELRAEVEKKSRMLLEVKGHLKQLAEREREREGQQALVAKERDALREQVKMVSSYWNFPVTVNHNNYDAMFDIKTSKCLLES